MASGAKKGREVVDLEYLKRCRIHECSPILGFKVSEWKEISSLIGDRLLTLHKQEGDWCSQTSDQAMTELTEWKLPDSSCVWHSDHIGKNYEGGTRGGAISKSAKEERLFHPCTCCIACKSPTKN